MFSFSLYHSSREVAWEQLCFKLTFLMNFIPVWVELPSNCTYFASDKTHQLSGFFDLLQVWTSWQMTQSFLVIKKYSLIQYFIPKVKAVHLPVLHKQNPLMLARWQYIVTHLGTTVHVYFVPNVDSVKCLKGCPYKEIPL